MGKSFHSFGIAVWRHDASGCDPLLSELIIKYVLAWRKVGFCPTESFICGGIACFTLKSSE
jgi:hypothetical protein